MSVPFYPWTVWIWAGLDPVLIALCLYLGWTATQVGKLAIAAIIGFAVAVLFSWAVTTIGVPWPAPVRHDGPTFFPVRAAAALLWSFVGFFGRRLLKPKL